MINKEKLLEISELNLAGKIEQMNELDLKGYIQLLYTFTDNLPEQDKRIKTALETKNYDALTKHLTALKGILEKIHADEMAADCAKQLTSLGVIKHEKLDAYLRHYFLFSLSTLAADIQKAEQQSEGKTAPNAPKNIVDKSKTINVEKLLAISELNLASKFDQMNENSFSDYVKILNAFTENYPDQEEKIKIALKTEDYDNLKKQLIILNEVLEKIFADEMAADCKKQIDAIGKTMPEKIEAFMRYFLSNLSMLSINIQLAQQKIDLTKLPEKENIESPSDIKILAVDDTTFFQTILKKVLQDSRYKLTCAASGREALKYLEKHTANMFLLDIEMPGMDGFELATRIREKGHKEPIIFLTGNAKKEHLAKALEAGATDFIIKPINKEILLAKIRKYI
jgi:CheY-like chemotaxis protein/HPt (histidine-containing phosphotransfer) domain-containing protein